MSEQSEQLVLDYLRQAGDAAYGRMRADERIDFLSRLRTRIEEFRTSSGAKEPEQVRKVLRRFGDPAMLVDRERDRLERERRESAEQPAAEAADADGAQEEGPITEPIPAVKTTDETGKSGREVAQPETATASPAGEQVSAKRDEPAAAEERTEAGAEAEPPGSTRPAPTTPQARPRHTGPPVYEPRSPREAGEDAPAAVSHVFDQLPPEVNAAFRSGAIEALGIVLLGFGGVLAPLPVWFIGVLFVAFATGWSLQDKLIALVPPPLLGVIGPAVFAMLDGGGVQSYPSALRTYGWTFFQVAAVVGTVYLAFVLIGRFQRTRDRRPPWQRTKPR